MKSMTEIFRSYCQFDANGRHIGGTDKASNHNYGDAYDRLFPDRSSVKLLLEIGITDGSSMLAWREAFQSAHIVGMDIEHCACEPGPRLEFHIGNQCNKAECERAAAGRLFDVIVEDAFHSTENTLQTLFYLWPFVRPGGMYIVEEWANVGGDRSNILALWPFAEVVETIGPSGGVEPLVVFRKPFITEHDGVAKFT